MVVVAQRMFPACMESTYTRTRGIPEILLVEDLAAALAISPQHCRRLLARGVLPGHRRGRRWIVLRHELLEHLAGDVEQRDG